MPETLNEFLALYDSLGLNYIPFQYKNKIPDLDEWKKYQETQATQEEKTKWFNNGRPINIGIVCGKTSGNLVILDFDKPEIIPQFFPKKDIREDTFSVKTGRGYHIYLRTNTPVKSRKIPGLIDVLSDGHLALAPPSTHPSGKIYESVGANKIINVNDFDEIFWKKAESLGYYHDRGMRTNIGQITKLPEDIPGCIKKLILGAKEGSRNMIGFTLAIFLKNQGKNKENITQQLYQWNDKNTPPLDTREVERIITSVLNNDYCVGCSTPLLSENCTSTKGECIYEDVTNLIKENTEKFIVKRPLVEGDVYEYEITIMGKKIKISSDEILTPTVFRQRWVEEHGKMIKIKDTSWRNIINFWHQNTIYEEKKEENFEQSIVDSILEKLSECDVTTEKTLCVNQKKYFYVEMDITKLPENTPYILHYPSQNIMDIINSTHLKADICRIHSLMKIYLGDNSKKIRMGNKTVRFWCFKNTLLDIDWKTHFIPGET